MARNGSLAMRRLFVIAGLLLTLWPAISIAEEKSPPYASA